MRQYLVGKLFLFVLLLLTISCFSVHESHENVEINDHSSEETEVNDNINKWDADNRLTEEEFAKIIVEFDGVLNYYIRQLDVFIELVEEKYIILHYINNNDISLLIPDVCFHVFFKGDNPNEKTGILSNTLHIIDDVGNELSVIEVFIDYAPFSAEDKCLKMDPGDEYVLKPVSLSSLIEMEKLIGTGTTIKIYYGKLEKHQSNVVTLTL